MPFVQRDEDGGIAALFAALQPEMAEEWLEEEDSEVLAFLTPEPPLPALTARQFRLGLLDADLTPAQVDAAIVQIEDEAERMRAQIEWQHASTFDRAHPLIPALSLALGLSDEQVDVMWAAAAKL